MSTDQIASDTDADQGVSVARALSVPTRAGIYRRLRTEGAPVSAREAAEMFGLHPNVARSHLDTLADAGLVVTGRRKQPGGGRPAKVYVARAAACAGAAGRGRRWSSLYLDRSRSATPLGGVWTSEAVASARSSRCCC